MGGAGDGRDARAIRGDREVVSHGVAPAVDLVLGIDRGAVRVICGGALRVANLDRRMQVKRERGGRTLFTAPRQPLRPMEMQ